MARQLRVSRLLWAIVDAALLGTLFFVLFMGFGLVGNRWYHIIGIQSGSMAPTFAPGDLILVMPPPDRIETGMVLVMDVGGELLTHRVVSVNADGTFATRGDANTVNDAWAGMDIKVEGRYVATIPWLGNVLPVRAASAASFVDRVTASMSITVGPWPPPPVPPTPPECAGMTFSQVLVGTPGDDTIDAGNGGALVFGLGGNDTITGGNGKDCLVGGDGSDILIGGNGKDVLLGGDGSDTLYGGGDNDVIEGGNGKDVLNGGDGIDTCYGTSKDTFVSCEAPATGSSTGVAAPVQPTDPTPTPSIEAGPSPAPTPMPDPTPDPGVTPTPGPTPDPGATPMPGPEATPGPTPSPTPGATPSPDPTPTPDPTPSPTPEPQAATFTFRVSGLTVTLTNQTTGAATWTWDFGDGTTSVERDPSHTYAAGGTYTVTLVAVRPTGATSSMSLEVTVTP